MSETLGYHQRELSIVSNLDDPRRCVPKYDCTGWRVLDVGCGRGQTLSAPEFAGAAELHGIDIDRDAIENPYHPHHLLKVAKAEDLPYPDAHFDLVFSRVAIPYTNIRRSLAEMYRVLKPEGRLWLTLHTWRQVTSPRCLKAFIDMGYIAGNTALFWALGRTVPRPWNGSYECVQTSGGIRRALRRFSSVTINRDRHFVVTARKSAHR